MNREEAIEILKDLWRWEHPNWLEKDIRQALEKGIEALKNQKSGHWITKEGKEQGYDIAGVKTWYIQIMCNECGFIKTAIEGHTGQYHYCPNCGAKMEGDRQ